PSAGFRYAGPAAEPTLPAQKPVTDTEIGGMIAGNTLVATNRRGAGLAIHTKPGGLFSSYVFPANPPPAGQQWSFARGTWRSEAGRLCLRYEGERQEMCYRVVAEADRVHAYDEKERSWRFSANVKRGNPFDL
ncbi:hypothetical protein, partial [Azospirillum sp.]|uniref:hypothetical protein n=1 Tax=Azospirillum sp. TaxID=34012 RepID=UPI002D3594F8